MAVFPAGPFSAASSAARTRQAFAKAVKYVRAVESNDPRRMDVHAVENRERTLRFLDAVSVRAVVYGVGGICLEMSLPVSASPIGLQMVMSVAAVEGGLRAAWAGAALMREQVLRQCVAVRSARRTARRVEHLAQSQVKNQKLRPAGLNTATQKTATPQRPSLQLATR